LQLVFATQVSIVGEMVIKCGATKT